MSTPVSLGCCSLSRLLQRWRGASSLGIFRSGGVQNAPPDSFPHHVNHPPTVRRLARALLPSSVYCILRSFPASLIQLFRYNRDVRERAASRRALRLVRLLRRNAHAVTDRDTFCGAMQLLTISCPGLYRFAPLPRCLPHLTSSQVLLLVLPLTFPRDEEVSADSSVRHYVPSRPLCLC